MDHRIWESLDRLAVVAEWLGGKSEDLANDDKQMKTFNRFVDIFERRKPIYWNFNYGQQTNVLEYLKIQQTRPVVYVDCLVKGVHRNLVFRVMALNDGRIRLFFLRGDGGTELVRRQFSTPLEDATEIYIGPPIGAVKYLYEFFGDVWDDKWS
jgi:hypothetical protein